MGHRDNRGSEMAGRGHRNHRGYRESGGRRHEKKMYKNPQHLLSPFEYFLIINSHSQLFNTTQSKTFHFSLLDFNPSIKMAKFSTIIVAIAAAFTGVQAACPASGTFCGSELVDVYRCMFFSSLSLSLLLSFYITLPLLHLFRSQIYQTPSNTKPRKSEAEAELTYNNRHH